MTPKHQHIVILFVLLCTAYAQNFGGEDHHMRPKPGHQHAFRCLKIALSDANKDKDLKTIPECSRLVETCTDDLSQYCSESPSITCLKTNSDKLKPRCLATFSKPRFDFDPEKFCQKDIETLKCSEKAGALHPERHLMRCLHRNFKQIQSNDCKEAIISFKFRACGADFSKFCGDVEFTRDEIRKCMMSHQDELSDQCKQQHRNSMIDRKNRQHHQRGEHGPQHGKRKNRQGKGMAPEPQTAPQPANAAQMEMGVDHNPPPSYSNQYNGTAVNGRYPYHNRRRWNRPIAWALPIITILAIICCILCVKLRHARKRLEHIAAAQNQLQQPYPQQSVFMVGNRNPYAPVPSNPPQTNGIEMQQIRPVYVSGPVQGVQQQGNVAVGVPVAQSQNPGVMASAPAAMPVPVTQYRQYLPGTFSQV